MKTFCEYCRDMLPFYVKNEKIQSNIKGINYSFSGKRAYCKECNNEVYVNSISDYNLKQLEEIVNIKNRRK